MEHKVKVTKSLSYRKKETDTTLILGRGGREKNEIKPNVKRYKSHLSNSDRE